jgi:hypothetical protein
MLLLPDRKKTLSLKGHAPALSRFSIYLGQIRAAGQDGAGGLCVPPLAPSRWTSLYGEYERLVNGSDPGKTRVTLTGLTCRATRPCCRNIARAGTLAVSSLRERTESVSRSRRTTFRALASRRRTIEADRTSLREAHLDPERNRRWAEHCGSVNKIGTGAPSWFHVGARVPTYAAETWTAPPPMNGVLQRRAGQPEHPLSGIISF